MTLTGMHHTGFHVAELQRSLDFYCGQFGFEVVWQRLNRDPYVREIVGYPTASLNQAMLRCPGDGQQLELIEYQDVERAPVDTSPPNPGTAHICLVVTDLRDTYALLTAAGVKSVGEPVTVVAGANVGRGQRRAGRRLHDRPGQLPDRAAQRRP